MWTFPIAFKRTYSIGIGFYNTANGYEQFTLSDGSGFAVLTTRDAPNNN